MWKRNRRIVTDLAQVAWYLLHRRFSEPGQNIWSGSDCVGFRCYSLDLLGWTSAWSVLSLCPEPCSAEYDSADVYSLGATLAAGFYKFIKLLQAENEENSDDTERQPLLS